MGDRREHAAGPCGNWRRIIGAGAVGARDEFFDYYAFSLAPRWAAEGLAEAPR